MRLTTKGRFAVTAMLDLALQESASPVALADISARQKLPLAYLEQLFGKLRRCKLVDSVRGPGGGYRLARGSDQISVAGIVVAAEESIDATLCGGKQNCKDKRKCLTHDLWAELNVCLFNYLDSRTLADLVCHERAKQTLVNADATAGRKVNANTRAAVLLDRRPHRKTMNASAERR